MEKRIRISYGKDEPLAANIFTDLNWLEGNMRELYEEYGRCVVIVYEKEIIGIGANQKAALKDAELRLPKDIKVVTAIAGDIHNPESFVVLINSAPIKKI